MIKIAIYGKGGIGKSTTSSNLSAALADKGLKVIQIGCDPKSDSTQLLMKGQSITTILDLMRSEEEEITLDKIVHKGYRGVLCVEAGGPTPGIGCAGRGIITAFEKLEELGAYGFFSPDVILYDVLGDVVCGGFAMPLRKQYADYVYIVTSGEKMSMFAASNIASALSNFKVRNYAKLGGLILNRRNVENEYEKVSELAEEIHSKIIGDIPRMDLVTQSELLGKTVIEAFPDSKEAEYYRLLATSILEECRHV
ncbi:nitrogenase iron protein NifH [Alkalibaculum bacchi]|mgnify:CR=1 FL=1|uniref:nitrogenase iron protein NifH n=1 Tax=Alkalibaculum bacchi TaxID=645887 RepID=UPI0026F1091E|nr:nitrogenase iron protein NifH [Alkalibaculum bacchi]